MSNILEDDDEATDPGAPKWVQDDNIELDEMCATYRQLEYAKKGYETAAKEIEAELKAQATAIQQLMGQHKAVRTGAGYTVEWRPFKRKGYTVEPSEGERWQLRSPF